MSAAPRPIACGSKRVWTSAYEARERNRRGQFATPPALAREIAIESYQRWRKRDDNVRFLDPAVGTGAFYSALRQVFPAERIDAAVGVELDRAIGASRGESGTGLDCESSAAISRNSSRPIPTNASI